MPSSGFSRRRTGPIPHDRGYTGPVPTFKTTVMRQASEPERRCIVDFFRTAATNAPYFESAYNADMLFARHDPAWPASEARRAMIEKWIGDPGVNEKTKTFWTEALAAFDDSTSETNSVPATVDPP